MKSLSTKLFALTLIVALAGGCASVTDAGLQPEPQQTVEQTAPDTTPDPVVGESGVEPIIDKPE